MLKQNLFLCVAMLIINNAFAMNFDTLAFKNEFIEVLTFWENNFDVDKDRIPLKEMSVNMCKNTDAPLGSMYLARIIYGSSVACKELNTHQYINLADKAYALLQGEFVNPAGGYYWAKDSLGEIIHSPENVNLGQAFILYGLAEYATLQKNATIDNVAQKQADFLSAAIRDEDKGGFLDGFDTEWNPLKDQDKALGTHLHMLEAYTKWFKYTKNTTYILLIENLIRILIDRFIDQEEFFCIHRLSPDWHTLPNENWAGHNAECSWILCQAAQQIQNKKLIEECNTLAIKMMDKVIEQAYCETGGVYNLLEDGKPAHDFIEWWPPAETVIGLLNAYQITGNQKYLNSAFETQIFISKHLISPSGEWYAAVGCNGNPNTQEPLIHFWKSMYHNIRYYVEVLNRTT